ERRSSTLLNADQFFVAKAGDSGFAISCWSEIPGSFPACREATAGVLAPGLDSACRPNEIFVRMLSWIRQKMAIPPNASCAALVARVRWLHYSDVAKALCSTGPGRAEYRRSGINPSSR